MVPSRQHIQKILRQKADVESILLQLPDVLLEIFPCSKRKWNDILVSAKQDDVLLEIALKNIIIMFAHKIQTRICKDTIKNTSSSKREDKKPFF